jgi:hypothetical protein
LAAFTSDSAIINSGCAVAPRRKASVSVSGSGKGSFALSLWLDTNKGHNRAAIPMGRTNFQSASFTVQRQLRNAQN